MVTVTDPDDKTDRSLIRSVRDGDRDAADGLFERYQRKLTGLAHRGLGRDLSGRLDPEDITQSVFRTFFRRISRGQYDVPPGETIWKLLSTIALNKIRAAGVHHRAAKRDVRKSTDVMDIASLSGALAGDEDALRILHLTIEEVIGVLTEPQQQIIQLRLEDRDIVSISQETGLSKRTVERVLHGFRAQLKKAIVERRKWPRLAPALTES